MNMKLNLMIFGSITALTINLATSFANAAGGFVETCVPVFVYPESMDNPDRLCVKIPAQTIAQGNIDLMGRVGDRVTLELYQKQKLIRTIDTSIRQFSHNERICNGKTGECISFNQGVKLDVTEPGFYSNYGVTIRLGGKLYFESFLFWSGQRDQDQVSYRYDRFKR